MQKGVEMKPKPLFKKVKCPACGKEEFLDENVMADAMREAKRFGVHTLVFRHVTHALLVYIDANGDVRGVDVRMYADFDTSLFQDFDLLPIPKRREDMPPLKRLSNKELAVLSLCDGESTLKMIAEKLFIPYGEAKAILEHLLQEGYLERIEEVIV